jgi:diguanylate cyclase (GGDEF)-like protein
LTRFPETDRGARVPQSPYEAELLRGHVVLRFPPSLEREFRQSHLERVAVRVRSWLLALLVLGLASTAYRLWFEGGLGWNLETVLRLGVLAPASVAMLVAAQPRFFVQRYLGTAFAGSMLVAVASSILIAELVAAGDETSLTFVTTNLFATFFLVGLLFFDALVVALIGVASFAIAGQYFGMTPLHLLYDTALLGIVAAVGAYIAWGVEETNRRFFLERGVLGDLAERDGLTGLRNRRAFDDHVLRVWQQSLRDRSSLSILLIDLDHFKRYNDFYGHQAGDACLRHVAQLVQRFARRPLDIAARYGGEELAIVLYQVTLDHALAIAEQLRSTIEAARIEHREAPARGLVTVSIGVAWLEATLDRTPEDTIHLADQALYAAKIAGRNRVHFLGRDELTRYSAGLKRVPRGVESSSSASGPGSGGGAIGSR